MPVCAAPGPNCLQQKGLFLAKLRWILACSDYQKPQQFGWIQLGSFCLFLLEPTSFTIVFHSKLGKKGATAAADGHMWQIAWILLTFDVINLNLVCSIFVWTFWLKSNPLGSEGWTQRIEFTLASIGMFCWPGGDIQKTWNKTCCRSTRTHCTPGCVKFGEIWWKKWGNVFLDFPSFFPVNWWWKKWYAIKGLNCWTTPWVISDLVRAQMQTQLLPAAPTPSAAAKVQGMMDQFLGTMVQITARFILIQEGHISQKITFNRWKSVLQEWTSCWSTWWNSCWQSCFCRIPNPFDQIKIRKFVSSTNWTIFDTIWTCCFVVSRWNHDETPISPHLWNGRHCWNQW